MLTNIYKYDDIIRLTFRLTISPILSPVAKTAYLAIERIIFC